MTGRELAVLRGHQEGLLAIDFSPDSRTLATGSADNTVKLWNVATRQEICTLDPHLGDIRKLKFVPDGSALIAICAEGRVKIWHAPSFEEIERKERAAAGKR